MRLPLRKPVVTNDAEKIAWLRLARTENVGPITFYRLVETFGTAQRALEQIPTLAARGGRKKPLVIPAMGTVEDEYAALTKRGGTWITAQDTQYPIPLSTLDDAPPVLSVLGNPELLARESIGMVGARNASLNGRKFAEQLARDLGKAGQVVVSGLARGIDTAAHVGSLDSGTVAVVAGGIDIVYPPENQKLYDQIIERGAIVAESPFGQQPFAQSFPRRNRIIAGLSAGVVVVEATLKSGSLITARLAGEQGRDVYAVPGHPLDPRAAGPNALIRDGAVLVRDAGDVLEHLTSLTGGKPPVFAMRDAANNHYQAAEPVDDPQSLDEARTVILEALSFEAVGVDELSRTTGVPISLVLVIVLELELAGRAKRSGGQQVALVA